MKLNGVPTWESSRLRVNASLRVKGICLGESCGGNSKNKFRRELYRILERFLERIIGSFRESFGKSNADEGRVMQNRGENIRGSNIEYGGEFWGRVIESS